ncbi:peroxidase-like [Melanaphis sacchari]|uniref:peroxidase-like n=1 Tax=Melanaphis sacchari TaxID=742174 RepID=UPI000DC154BF|nr:peroxidase-like [Melanaphis sacchari]
MSTTMSITLLICMSVLLNPCCKGFEGPCKPSNKPFGDNICKNGVIANITNRYHTINTDDIEEAIKYGFHSIEFYIDDIESKKLNTTDVQIKIGSPTHGQLIESQLSEDGYLAYWNAEVITHSSFFMCSSRINGIECAKKVSKIKLDNSSLGDVCLSDNYNRAGCNGMNLKYRSLDGYCNNLKHFYLGRATMPYTRLLFPAYLDGVYRVTQKLPNPRILRNELVVDEDSPDPLKTMVMAYWTIFIRHDLSHTVISSMRKTKVPVKCCNDEERELSPRDTYDLCMQIRIPDNDTFFSNSMHRCMNYVRSVPAVRPDCTFGPKDQMNQATHYLDGSMIYGTSAKHTWSLRSKTGGQLLSDEGCVHKTKGNPLQPQYMPLEDIDYNKCQYGTGTCYRSGDDRVNGLPQLTVMHTLWMREHNRLAKTLSYLNPHWDDDRIFQEARKIVIASIQHITYAEWLPTLLGKDYTMRNGLQLLTDGYSNAYNESADPSVSNSFATAILPFANSMLSDTISLYLENRAVYGSLSLKEHYNRPTNLLMNYMDLLVRGLSTQNTQKVDMLFTQTITNYLYSVHPNNLFGMDIVSLDIQRSRDHGIPSYTEYRKFCGLKGIESLQDLSQTMVPGSVDRLLKLYKTWNDIDLLIGALFEKHVDDAMVGPTMRCIVREQFVRTRIADRYFYDLPDVFNKDQLREIRKVSLARIFCDNSNNVTKMQKQAFLKPSVTDLQLCKSQIIPNINLNHWAEMVD